MALGLAAGVVRAAEADAAGLVPAAARPKAPLSMACVSASRLACSGLAYPPDDGPYGPSLLARRIPWDAAYASLDANLKEGLSE